MMVQCRFMKDFRNAVFLWIMTGVQLLHFVVCACITATLCSQLSQRVEAKENEKEGNDVAGESPLAEGGKDDTKKPEAPKAPSLFVLFCHGTDRAVLCGTKWDTEPVHNGVSLWGILGPCSKKGWIPWHPHFQWAF